MSKAPEATEIPEAGQASEAAEAPSALGGSKAPTGLKAPEATERLQKIITARGAASRREAERLIQEGRVTVNGIAARIGDRADPAADEIRIDGALLKPSDKPLYIMLNKPRGYITTAKDDRGRQTAVDLVSGAGARVYPVGRLDMESEGLLLLTNDGDFANSVMHPSNNKIKLYEVRVTGNIAEGARLMRGPVSIGDHIVKAESIAIKSEDTRGGVLTVGIVEGRNRQVRRMCESCSLKVLSLKRIAIGSLELGSLKAGAWRHLTKEEVAALNEERSPII
ncbi:MAG: rRNA pseudouridine synthase [Oscillospiraceae bacterium]|nr:rRNA pseudouridine synthase [Oscillospiraceae bacterium]